MGILSLSFIFTSTYSKTRRKDAKESSPPIGGDDSDGSTASASNHNSSTNSQHLLPYLRPEDAIFTRAVSESNITELIRQPAGVDKNEWIASNIVSFFNHVNLLYGAMSDYCTQSICPTMTGPQNSQYYWYDERGRKVKCSAPEYIDYAMMYIQRQLNDETIFPTRLDQLFPISFDVHVRKIVRYLFHCVAHLYSSHYRDCISIHLHPHLNSLFLHFLTFLFTFHINGTSSSTTVDNVNNLIVTTTTQLSPQDNNKNDLKSDIDTLDMLYQLLAQRWKGIYQEKLKDNIDKTKITSQSQSQHQSRRKTPTTSSNFLYEQQQLQTQHTSSLSRTSSRNDTSLSNANSNVTLISHE